MFEALKLLKLLGISLLIGFFIGIASFYYVSKNDFSDWKIKMNYTKSVVIIYGNDKKYTSETNISINNNF